MRIIHNCFGAGISCQLMLVCYLTVVCLASTSSESVVYFPYPPAPIIDSTPSKTTTTDVESKTGSIETENVDLNDFLVLHQAVKTCFEGVQATRSLGQATGSSPPTVMSYNSTLDPVIIVDNWIDETVASDTLILAECVRIHAPQNYEYRPFGGRKYAGGNNVTFLNQYMQAVYPQALEQILSVAGAVTETVGWRPHPRHLGIRCIELLEYEAGGEL
jgi:hypothetical protein